MKKNIGVIAAAILAAAALTACGGSKTAETSAAESSAAAAETSAAESSEAAEETTGDLEDLTVGASPAPNQFLSQNQSQRIHPDSHSKR